MEQHTTESFSQHHPVLTKAKNTCQYENPKQYYQWYKDDTLQSKMYEHGWITSHYVGVPQENEGGTNDLKVVKVSKQSTS